MKGISDIAKAWWWAGIPHYARVEECSCVDRATTVSWSFIQSDGAPNLQTWTL